MSAAAEAYACMCSIEALTNERLDAVTREASSTIIKSAISYESALAVLEAGVSEVVLAMRAVAREQSSAHYAMQTLLATTPTGTDDSERGPKAAAWYGKAWTKAIESLSDEPWASAVEQAREAATKALERIACFEVVDAWNDEHRKHVQERISGPLSGPFIERWMTLGDQDVCPDCKKLHGVYTDDKGQFPGDVWPPLHVMCRCFVVTEIRALPEEEGKSMGASATASVYRDAGRRGLPLGERVELSDAPLMTRAFEVKAIDVERRIAHFVASTSVVDAHDEIVDQDSWILDDYLKNPVVLFAHQSRELPIGKSVNVQLVNGPRGAQLENSVEFATEEMNPLAEQVWKMLVSKFLRAVSVGFVPRSYRYEMREGVEVWVWADCVLKEISVTPVPANPEALAKMKSLALEVRNGPRTTTRGASNNDSGIALRGGDGSIKQDPRTGVPVSDDNEPAERVGTTKGHEVMKTIEQLQKELDTVTAKSDATTAKLGELNVKLVETEQRAEKAEAAKTVAEKALDNVQATVTKLEAAAKTLETEHTKACTDRDANAKRADTAEAQLIELEVESIVGKKIAPTEKEEFITLRKKDPELFTKMVAKRADMQLTERVTTPDAKANPEGKTSLDGSNGASATKAVDAFNSLA